MKKYKNNISWFWKLNKKEYQNMLKKLSKKNKKRKIKKYENETIVRVNWITFYKKKKFSFFLCIKLYNNIMNFILQLIVKLIQLRKSEKKHQYNYIKNK